MKPVALTAALACTFVLGALSARFMAFCREAAAAA